MARGAKQPPKKKHTTKERSVPVVALSDAEREFFADEAEQKAEIHLGEAQAIANWGNAPNAGLHSAYYSMHFCAVAALYRAGGIGKRKDVPQSHEHVLRHYILMSETVEDPFIRQSGMLLNRARDDRMRADYFIGSDQTINSGIQGASPEEATEAAELAVKFLQAWQDEWNRALPSRLRRPLRQPQA